MIYIQHIPKTIETFFDITQIPIKVFSIHGKFICDYGHNEYSNNFIKKNKIIKKIQFKIETTNFLNSKFFINFKEEKVHFIAFGICCKNITNGYYLLGPFSINKNSLFIYKPKKALKLLPCFLYSIANEYIPKDVLYLKQNHSNNLHVRKAIDYIYQNYQKNVTLTEITSFLNIHKSYFCFIFKNETKTTFTNFLNDIRIEKSLVLLKNPSLSILDISLMVGFNNQNYFGMIFKKKMGISPHIYRKK